MGIATGPLSSLRRRFSPDGARLLGARIDTLRCPERRCDREYITVWRQHWRCQSSLFVAKIPSRGRHPARSWHMLNKDYRLVSRFSCPKGLDQHTRSTLEVRTTREDSPASSHGGGGSLAAGPELRGECAWAAHVGTPRRCANVVSPCDEEVRARRSRLRVRHRRWPSEWLATEIGLMTQQRKLARFASGRKKGMQASESVARIARSAHHQEGQSSLLVWAQRLSGRRFVLCGASACCPRQFRADAKDTNAGAFRLPPFLQQSVSSTS